MPKAKPNHGKKRRIGFPVPPVYVCSTKLRFILFNMIYDKFKRVLRSPQHGSNTAVVYSFCLKAAPATKHAKYRVLESIDNSLTTTPHEKAF